MAVAHVTTLAGGKQAIAAGVNGLAHLFFDKPPDAEFIRVVRKPQIFGLKLPNNFRYKMVKQS
jgi:hypothetical protein